MANVTNVADNSGLNTDILNQLPDFTMEKYIESARMTMRESDLPMDLVHMNMGMVGEFGEVLEDLLYGKSNYISIGEMGDFLWYASIMSELLVKDSFVHLIEESIQVTNPYFLHNTEKLVGYMNVKLGQLTDYLKKIMFYKNGELTITDIQHLQGGKLRSIIKIWVALIFNLRNANKYRDCELSLRDFVLYVGLVNNIKLSKRYQGKFSEEKAINRDYAEESKVTGEVIK